MSGRRVYYYEATGAVAHERISPLLPTTDVWNDVTNNRNTKDASAPTTTTTTTTTPDFLWENTPRRESKDYRDSVKVYSHLPNGTNILDSKWVLGRLFADAENAAISPQQSEGGCRKDPNLATLETHCFRGLDGFQTLAQKLHLLTAMDSNKDNNEDWSVHSDEANNFPDLMDPNMNLTLESCPSPSSTTGPANLWVVKDAMANGAGGIWVVGPENAAKFMDPRTSPLYPEHRYVAQRYVWPPVLFGGRKCHVRVYGLLTCDGRAFVHHRSFLHVANDPFTTRDAVQMGQFQDSIHITNCCANSHDQNKFAGEILADLEQTKYSECHGQSVVPLGAFFPSIRACMTFLAERVFPLVQGGQANHGFEYLGVDFMLSYDDEKRPLAHILEINAPPSQDTATGLPHAENLHNEVIRDLITLWVLPHVTGVSPKPGGWRCVYSDEATSTAGDNETGEWIAPSKASIINKIKWSMFEKRALKKEAEDDQDTAGSVEYSTDDDHGTQQNEKMSLLHSQKEQQQIAAFARSQFPYFSDAPQVFFENAGGSQVAKCVIDAMSDSLQYRHRDMMGSKLKSKARQCIRSLLGARDDDTVFLGPNATTLFASLADAYVRNGLLKGTDEVVVSIENHLANFDPWIRAGRLVGATIKLWTPFGSKATMVEGFESSMDLNLLVTHKTRIVAIPHTSNILGQIRDIKRLGLMIKIKSEGYAHVVVDGVAAVPHWFADFAACHVDWYGISCHKVFGPHLGALCGRQSGAIEQLSLAAGLSSGSNDSTYKLLEAGTINYEGCAGVIGMLQYFAALAATSHVDDKNVYGVGVVLETQAGSTSAEQPEKRYAPSSMDRLNNSLKIVVSKDQVRLAYQKIRSAEVPLVGILLEALTRSPRVHILEVNDQVMTCHARLPTISFFHAVLSPQTIVSVCETHGIVCRACSFLCTPYFADAFNFDHAEGVVRVSLAHYNTFSEVNALLRVLNHLPGW